MHDVIIPARNESPETLLPTIWAFRQQPDVNNIILSDDGLTLEALDALYRYPSREFSHQHTCAPCLGKGQAVKHALNYVTADRVVFCDGDLHNFTVGHAQLLTHPSWTNQMVLGVTEPLPDHPPRPVPDHIHTLVTGERSVPVSLVRGLDLHGYCMEVQVNAAAERAKLPIEIVKLHGCRGTSRWTPARVTEMKRDGAWLREHGA